MHTCMCVCVYTLYIRICICIRIQGVVFALLVWWIASVVVQLHVQYCKKSKAQWLMYSHKRLQKQLTRRETLSPGAFYHFLGCLSAIEILQYKNNSNNNNLYSNNLYSSIGLFTTHGNTTTTTHRIICESNELNFLFQIRSSSHHIFHFITFYCLTETPPPSTV